MIRKRLIHAAIAAQLGLALFGAAPSVASPGPLLGGQPTAPANVIPFTCTVHAHLHTCGHLTVQPGEHVFIQMDSDSPLDTALFCVPRRGGGMRCRQLHSADDNATDFGPSTNNQVIRLPINVGVGAPDRQTGTVTGTWWSQ